MRVGLAWMLGGCFFGASDDSTPDDDTGEPVVGDTDPDDDEMSMGDVIITVDGETYRATLSGDVQLNEIAASTMTFSAEGAVFLSGVVSDSEAPLAEGTYPFGSATGLGQAAGIALGIVDLGGSRSFGFDDDGGAEGTMTIDRLDRDAGLVSLQWSAELTVREGQDQVVTGTATVEGRFEDRPLNVTP